MTGPRTGLAADPNASSPGVIWNLSLDPTTTLGVDLLPTFVGPFTPTPIPGQPAPPTIPSHNIFTNLIAQNLIGQPPGPGGQGPKIGFGVTVLVGAAQSSGRFYFEVTYTQFNLSSFNGGVAIAPYSPTTKTYRDLSIGSDASGNGGHGLGGVLCDGNGFGIWTNGTYSNASLPTVLDPNFGNDTKQGDVLGVAVDLTAGLVWFKCISGPDSGLTPDWNGGGAPGGIGAGSQPTGRVLGIPLPVSTNMVPYLIFGGETAPQVTTMTVNFGALGFAIRGDFPLFYEPWPPPNMGKLLR